MNITPSPNNVNRSTFSPGVSKYKGPDDGMSQTPKKWAQRVSKAVLGLAYRTELSGAENLPKDGVHVYAPNHPSFNDPLVLRNIVDGDMRIMAAIELYGTSPVSKALEWGGAFPVNRESAHPTTIHHGASLLKDGASLGIFPEGGISETPGEIGAFKAGAAYFAVKGGAESIVPVAMDYQQGVAPTRKQKIKNLVKGAVVGGLALAGAVLGGPVGLAAVGIATGAVAGAFAGGKLARKLVKNPNTQTPYPKLIAGIVGAAVGGIAGAVAAPAVLGALSAPAAASLVTTASAAATYGWSDWKASRDVAKVSVGAPLDVKEAVNKHGSWDAIEVLSKDLHQAVGYQLAEQTNIPYDVTAPKLK